MTAINEIRRTSVTTQMLKQSFIDFKSELASDPSCLSANLTASALSNSESASSAPSLSTTPGVLSTPDNDVDNDIRLEPTAPSYSQISSLPAPLVHEGGISGNGGDSGRRSGGGGGGGGVGGGGGGGKAFQAKSSANVGLTT